MKRIAALLVSLALICCTMSAFAGQVQRPVKDEEGNIISQEIVDEETGRVYERWSGSDFASSESAMKILYDQDGGWTIVEQYKFGKLLSYGKTRADEAAGKFEFENYDGNGNLLSHGTSTTDADTDTTATYLYMADGSMLVTYDDGENAVSVDGDGKVVWAMTDDAFYDSEGGKWLDQEGKEIAAPDISALVDKARGLLEALKTKAAPEPIWYPNNTAGVVGIRLRDEYPGLTDKWYNVLPVDLSHDGTQTFDLIASYMFCLGKVNVTVSGDDVTVTYSYLSSPTGYEIYPKGECLAWFTGVEQITHDFLENPAANATFGQPISIENDLNGQKTALLFICNRVTYRVPLDSHGAAPREFWPNSSLLKDYYAGVKQLFEQNEAAYAESQAEAGE